MGRAIDMEKDIGSLKSRLSKVEDALARVINVVDSMEEKSQTTTHIDLNNVPAFEDVEVKEEVIEKPKAKKGKKKIAATSD